MKTKRVVKLVAFCLILFLFLNYIYDVFSWKDTAGDYYSSMDTFYDLDGDLVDVMFLGSSRCYCTINNAQLWDEHGISSFSLAISGQDIVSSYHALKEGLKTQTPDAVCLELYGTLFWGYGVDSNLYRNTLPYSFSPNALSLVNEIGGDIKEDLLLKWPIVHTRYKELKKGDFVDNPPYIGYHAEFRTVDIGAICLYDGDETMPIGEDQEYWLRKIIELAQEKEIEVCLFVSPFVADETSMKKLNYVEGIAEEYGVLMVNTCKMEKELGLSPKTDFLDGAHTNYSGATKVTKYMGQLLVDEFGIQDRRGQKGYELWVENSKVRKHEVNNMLLQQTGSVDDFFAQLSQMEDGYTVVVETNGGYYTDEALMEAYATSIGISELAGNSGVWIVEDGEVELNLQGEAFGQYYALGQSDMLIHRDGGVSNIIINDVPYIRAWDGVNVIVYDNLLDMVVDSASFTPVNQYQLMR
ncbi:MAG: hypothetical protein IJW63_04820 [Lachnospiraceae bacterium]|nr:hypothetical protein [Lachnospiraceae bacterium]